MRILPKEIRDTQKRIEIRVESLLEAACDPYSGILEDAGGINWADLHVIDVIYCVGNDGAQWYIVEISEVAPECWPLQKYIYEGLHGFSETIEVRTEW